MTFNEWWQNNNEQDWSSIGCEAAEFAWHAAKADSQEDYDKKEAAVTQLREHIRVMEDAEGLYKAEIDAKQAIIEDLRTVEDQ